MVYYLKYRPQSLTDLVGQEIIAQTLRKSLESNRLAHAYLFCGPRGVGKTSTARILAKMVNCTGGVGDSLGLLDSSPAEGDQNDKAGQENKQVPCNKCVACISITDGSSMDLIEIDAASNRGIDDIRELRDRIKLSPTHLKKKVYVIDECFRYEDLISLADGSKLPIGKIVENGLPVEVLSYNEQTHSIEPKPIIGYMKKRPELPSVQITFNNNRVVVCTVNHRFYTPEGLIPAEQLKRGQFVYANYSCLTQQQLDVIAGAVLGDGHISLTSSEMRGRLSMTHGVMQKEYLDYKIGLLGDLITGDSKYQFSEKTFSKKGTYRTCTLSFPQIAMLREELYGGLGKRQISMSFLDKITPLGLAIWYMDDGSLVTQNHFYKRKNGSTANYPNQRSTLSTYSFGIAGTSLILKWLYDKWGIKGGMTKSKKGPSLWLTLEGTEKLHELIAPYVHTSMNYKLLPKYRNKFVSLKDDKKRSDLSVSRVKDIKLVSSPEYVYNIEVADNHNYFVRDILVANCHMLTNEAFNALLKTLEEPPEHCLFILATTEVQKIPQTILSRVQRLDFQPASTEALIKALKRVVDGEALEVDDEALKLIARKSDGSFRDGVKLLDQLSSSGGKVTASMVDDNLRNSKFESVVELLNCLAKNESKRALELAIKDCAGGANLKEYVGSIMELLRLMLLIKHHVTDLVKKELTAEKYQVLESLSQDFTAERLVEMLGCFQNSVEKLKFATLSSLPIEIAIIESCIEKSQGHVIARNEVTRPFEEASPLVGKKPIVEKDIDRQSNAFDDKPVTHMKSSTPAEVGVPVTEERKKDDIEGSDLSKIHDKWTYILETVKPYNYSLEAMLRSIKVGSCEDGRVTLRVPYSFHQRILETPRNRDLLESVLTDVLGKPARVLCELDTQLVKVEDIANVEMVAADDEVIRLAAEIFNS